VGGGYAKPVIPALVPELLKLLLIQLPSGNSVTFNISQIN
jgi:hypothetical protein